MRLLGKIKKRFQYGLFAPKRPAISLVEALTRVSGGRVIKHVLTASPDRRHWGTLAAAWIGISERELQTRLADALGLEVAEPNSKVPAVTLLGEKVNDLIPELKRVAASPYAAKENRVGLLCIDPIEARSLELGFSVSEYKLSTWGQISALLDQLEEEIQKQDAEKQSIEREQSEQVAEQVLGFLLAEVESYQRQELDILTGEDGLIYQFFTQENKRASGKVFPRVAPTLVSLLSRFTPGVTQGIFLRSKSATRKLSVTKLAKEGNYRLSWRVDDQEPGLNGIQNSKQDLPEKKISGKEESKEAGIKEENFERKEIKQEVSPVLPGNSPQVSSFTDSSQTSSRPLVVVIDDNVMFVKVLERFLDRAGMDIIHARNGEEGIKILKGIVPARQPVVICDLHMPVMNGREVISRLRADEALKKLRVIILSSDDDIEAEITMISHGADSFVAKSKDPRFLTSQVKRFVEATSATLAAA